MQLSCLCCASRQNKYLHGNRLVWEICASAVRGTPLVLPLSERHTPVLLLVNSTSSLCVIPPCAMMRMWRGCWRMPALSAIGERLKQSSTTRAAPAIWLRLKAHYRCSSGGLRKMTIPNGKAARPHPLPNDCPRSCANAAGSSLVPRRFMRSCRRWIWSTTTSRGV